MWISRMAARGAKEREKTALTGEVTIGGEGAGVFTSHEARGAIVVSPGGYSWRPSAGEGVLVIKGSAGESYIAGRIGGEAGDIGEGEVRIATGKDGASEIVLKNNGDIFLRGNVRVEGELYINGQRYVPSIFG